MFLARKILPRLKSLLNEKQILVLTGMRRVGKTTLIKHLFNDLATKNKIYYSFEDTLTRKKFSDDNYENLKRMLEGEGITFTEKAYIFIDEIQFLPNITSVIKYFYDEYDVKFVVTGSSSYYLKNHFTESLSGRKFVVELYPLTFNEFLVFKGEQREENVPFSKKVDLNLEIYEGKYKGLYEEYMKYGGFPDVVLNPSIDIKQEILKDIINSYFQIDVTTIADFDDIGKLRDLLIILTQRVGQKINISNISNVLKINRAKVYEYLELLKSTYVIHTVSQHSSADNRISADDKFYFSDTGIANVLSEVAAGSIFENSVFMNLVYDYDLTYYQTKSGGEIDFVLNKKLGIEVKETASAQDLLNLGKRAISASLDEYYIVTRNYSPIEKTIFAWDL